MPKLKKIEFECEVITPMFLAGANQNKPELRVASLRGELRWWLRALLGSYLNADVGEVSKWEAKLLGDSSEEGQSKFLIRLRHEPFSKSKEAALPHKPEKKQQAWFDCIPAGTSFTLIFQSLSANEVEWDVLTSTFELFALLGGVGRRSRRGFGNFQPRSWSFQDANSVKDFAIEKIHKVQDAFKRWVGKVYTLQTPTPYPIFAKDCSLVHVAEPQICKNFIIKLMKKISNELSAGNLTPNVLGGIKPRQASTMIVSVVRLNDKIVPFFTNFICNTALKPQNSQFKNIIQFPSTQFSAKRIF